MIPSVFDIFKIGIGPSSSHTVGPMIACGRFIEELTRKNLLAQVDEVKVYLYGSLAMTGIGHATDKAVLLGLMGHTPEFVPVEEVSRLIDQVMHTQRLELAGTKSILFDYNQHLQLVKNQTLPEHPNGMKIFAFDHTGLLIHSNTYFSIGGGSVLDGAHIQYRYASGQSEEKIPPYPFANSKELLAQCQSHKKTISEIVLANESVFQSEEQTRRRVLGVWQVMEQSIERGCHSDQVILPGGLNVRARAPNLYKKVERARADNTSDALSLMDWVSLYAIAVNEENARGGRVVTSPTNGSAGVIPSVLQYYLQFVLSPQEDAESVNEAVLTFLLTASAIGSLYKRNASISAAEMGCQGEIGVSSSMAAAGLSAVLGGSCQHIENAAEIAMEHHLGMTCDPINGLVQIPCIERNSMGALKAINASRLALMEDGNHLVSLDDVIATMRETGNDMQSKYKETATGGLATVNRVGC